MPQAQLKQPYTVVTVSCSQGQQEQDCARFSLLPAFMEAVNEYSRNSLGWCFGSDALG